MITFANMFINPNTNDYERRSTTWSRQAQNLRKASAVINLNHRRHQGQTQRTGPMAKQASCKHCRGVD